MILFRLMRIFIERSLDSMPSNSRSKKLPKEENKTKYTLISQNHLMMNLSVYLYLFRSKRNTLDRKYGKTSKKKKESD